MFDKRLLLPHQYYYPNMNFLRDRSTAEREEQLYNRCQSLSGTRKGTIYIHIPFCNSKCAFCGFDKEYETEEMSAYVDKVLEEMHYYSTLLADKYVIQSIHFGGGTPTLLPGDELQRLLDGVKNSFTLDEACAVDAEGSATTMYRDDIIDFILSNHLTRMSFGVQSFNEKIRNEMNMKATLNDVMYTLQVLKKNHIKIFGDILYGYPDFQIGNLTEILAQDIDTAIAVGLDGVEFGQMYPFKNQLERIVKERNLRLPEDQEIMDMIQIGTEKLLDAGYSQTTYSGFVKNGKIILETSYFGGIEEMPDCIAMGSGAFGNVAGFKYRNASYNVYMNYPAPCYGQLKQMTQEQIENMQIVGFPKVLVLNKQLLEKDSVKERFADKFRALKAEGYIDENKTAFYLTPLGKLYIDNIYWYLLEEEEQENLKKEIVVYVAGGKDGK